VAETLPESDCSSGRVEGRLPATAHEREQRMTELFRRWPALDSNELRELRRIWNERIRDTKHHASDSGLSTELSRGPQA
jgi:hypothetical protein